MSKTAKPKTGTRKKEQVRTSKGTYSVKLTRKQKAWSDTYLEQPKAPLTDIARQTYNVTDAKVAHDISRQNLENPRIIQYIEEHQQLARDKIVNLVSSNNERIALDASKDILDRTQGKATQRTEVKSTRINISLGNLTE